MESDLETGAWTERPKTALSGGKREFTLFLFSALFGSPLSRGIKQSLLRGGDLQRSVSPASYRGSCLPHPRTVATEPLTAANDGTVGVS